jgi:hypothetical protein
MDDAAHSINLIFKASDSIKDDPTLIHCGARLDIIVKGSNILRDVSALGRISADEARKLDRTLSKTDLDKNYATAMKGERAFVIFTFDNIRRNGARAVFGETSLSPMAMALLSPLTLLRESYIGRPFLYSDELFSLRHWKVVIAATNKPYRKQTRYDRDPYGASDGAGGPFSAIFAPILNGMRASVDRSQAEITGSRILLALQVYKSHFGSYPESLDKINTRLSWGVPLEDPFSGKDFVYHRSGQGFLLYSIGANLKDDGGQAPRPRENPYEAGDIVWQMDH